jgi:plastocyanin
LRLALVCACAVAAIGVFAACKEPSGGNTCASVRGVPIDAHDNQTFDTPVTVQPTQPACWQNLGTLTHSITADDLIADSIDIVLPPDYTYSKSWGTSGKDFHYHCRYHAGMTGLVQVR